jgi:acyl-CoA dehydrogenase
MVDFTLTDEQKALRELAHDFATKGDPPRRRDYDRDGTSPQAIIEKVHEIGLMNVHVSEEYGGPGLSYLDGCVIEEEIAWGCSGIGTSLSANGLAPAPVHLGASDEIKREYFEELVSAPSSSRSVSPSPTPAPTSPG